MSEDDGDDPVMALLATQRAVLAAVENLAAQVEAMQGQLGVMAEAIDRLTGDQASAATKGAPVSLGARFSISTGPKAEAEPELPKRNEELSGKRGSVGVVASGR